MPRKYQPKRTKYSNIYELEMSNGEKNYLARFAHNGTRYSDKNLTKLFGSKTAKIAFEKLSDIKIQLSKGVDVFSSKSDKVDELVYAYLGTRNEEYIKRLLHFIIISISNL
jgi:predicted P-loop ATPase